MEITVTNYVRPNGRREVQILPLSNDDLQDKVRMIEDRGLRFESEYLTTGDWSITITDDEEGDLANEIIFRSQMGENARAAVIARFEKMIREFEL